ncbi:hypothetical protein ACFLRW_00205 [Acidobacteriota bacterium]
MVFNKCPGQNLSTKKIEDAVSERPCPSCEYPVEFFFDDISRICPNCGRSIEKDEDTLKKDFGCATWCDSAEDCLSPAAYSQIKKRKKRQ